LVGVVVADPEPVVGGGGECRFLVGGDVVPVAPGGAPGGVDGGGGLAEVRWASGGMDLYLREVGLGLLSVADRDPVEAAVRIEGGAGDDGA
jgi:hypothetical protein